MKKTRLVLDYEYPFDLLGITSSVKFYKLAWNINGVLKINLIRQEDFLLEFTMGAQQFANYSFQEGENLIRLFRNRSMENEKHLIAPELSHFDYLLRIDHDSQSFATKEILKQLKDVKCIEYIGAVDVKRLKSRDNFLE